MQIGIQVGGDFRAMDASSAGGKPPDEVEIYKKDYKKYFVLIKTTEECSRLKLAKVLFKKYTNKILNIIKIAKTTYKVECVDKLTANDMATNVLSNDFNAFIPQFCKYVYGVIKGVDTDITESEIIDICNSNGITVKRAIRLNRFDREMNTVAPTLSVKLIIEADELPDSVKFYGFANFKIHEFNQRVKKCVKCLSFGHFIDFCRSNRMKCVRCGQDEHGVCKRALNCASCGGDHCFGDSNCHQLKIEDMLLKVMNNNKFSYFEAKDWLQQHSGGEAFKLVVKEFPALEEVRLMNKKTIKKKTTTEKNNDIALELNASVAELKKLREMQKRQREVESEENSPTKTNVCDINKNNDPKRIKASANITMKENDFTMKEPNKNTKAIVNNGNSSKNKNNISIEKFTYENKNKNKK